MMSGHVCDILGGHVCDMTCMEEIYTDMAALGSEYQVLNKT